MFALKYIDVTNIQTSQIISTTNMKIEATTKHPHRLFVTASKCIGRTTTQKHTQYSMKQDMREVNR